MKTFQRNSQAVMDHIKMASHESSLYHQHCSCFKKFGTYLTENGLTYSSETASSWLKSQNHSEGTLRVYARALQKLDDVYVYGAIQFSHQMRMPLLQVFDETLQEYLCGISGAYSPSHLENIKNRCRYFLRFLQQQRKITSFEDVSYHDILDFCGSPLETLSKEDHSMYKGTIMRFLEWLSQKQLCPAGFAMLLFHDRAKKTFFFR